jgi:hypothetical protein
MKAVGCYRHAGPGLEGLWPRSGKGHPPQPRLLSENGSSYIAADLVAKLLDGQNMTHIRSAPYHPMTQGKIERWHQTLKNRILLENYYLRGDLEAQITAFVTNYNNLRYHEGIGNSMPETDANLTKFDLCPVNVVAVDAAGHDVAVIGALPYAQYDRVAYERAAGIVTLPLMPETAKAARENDLMLRNTTGRVLAVEARLRAIPDTPNLYRDEGSADNGAIPGL